MGNTHVSTYQIGSGVSSKTKEEPTLSAESEDQSELPLQDESHDQPILTPKTMFSVNDIHDDSLPSDEVEQSDTYFTTGRATDLPPKTLHSFPLKIGESPRIELFLEAREVQLAEKSWLKRTFEPSITHLEILAAFMSGVCQLLLEAKVDETQGSSEDLTKGDLGKLLKNSFDTLRSFQSEVPFDQINIHCLSSNRHVLQALYNAKSWQEAILGFAPNLTTESALLTSSLRGHTGFFSQFGGQGYLWLPELTQLYNTYPFVRRFVELAAQTIKGQVKTIHAQVLGSYRHGFDVLSWIQEPSTSPSKEYLTSAPISYPMICLTQLAHYLCCITILQKTPADFLQCVRGSSGHSQGIVAAIVAASSKTFENFIENSCVALAYLFWHGARSQQVFRPRPMEAKLVQESVAKGYGTPTPMLSVRGLTIPIVKAQVAKVNTNVATSRHAYLALVNGPTSCIISGDPYTLYRLRELLSTIQADPKQSQARIPYSRRKLGFHTSYLPVSVPFHCPLLAAAVPLILSDVKRLELKMNFESLLVPVYSTYDASNLQASKDLLQTVVEMQCVSPVRWDKVCQAITATTEKRPTHVLDFGPGGVKGTATLTAENTNGLGIQVIACGSFEGTAQIPSKAALMDSRSEKIPMGTDWFAKFGPKVIQKSQFDEKKHSKKSKEASESGLDLEIVTKFTKIYGKPPLLVAGMTPCTAGHNFCAAVTNAGYNIELAGGGQPSPNAFKQRIHDLTSCLTPGEGITVNLLFLNPRLWGFQFPLCLSLRKAGYPIEGITIAAGVPSPDKADEILAQCREAGISRVGFKPGSVEAIKAVVDIAKANPLSHVILQWTGGRAGGHHSNEDQHQPILETYPRIREVENIILVVGGGLGDHTSALPYINGQWSVSLGYPPMPFDAILMGTRMMVAKECPTETAVKELIVKTPGVIDSQWEKSLESDGTGAGGVITVTSELGEPIHKIYNKGTAFWRQMDRKYFALSPTEMAEAVKKDRKEIIDQMNASYQKPFFGKKKSGKVAYDLKEMTYFEVAERLAALMCPPSETKREWIEPSYQARFNDFIIRIIERFFLTTTKEATAPLSEMSVDDEDEPTTTQRPRARSVEETELEILTLLRSNDGPDRILDTVAKAYPQSEQWLLSPEDEAFFIALCKRQGKPVNFIPSIDQDLKFWMKKDSLWYSEDMRSVPEKDPQRVMILQGPVSTVYSTKVNEPAKDILDNIYYPLAKALFQQQAKESTASITPDTPLSEQINFTALETLQREFAETSSSQVKLTFSIPTLSKKEINQQDWLRLIALSSPASSFESVSLYNSWRCALLLSSRVIRRQLWLSNPLSQMFVPRPGQIVELLILDRENLSDVDTIRIYDSAIIDLGLPKDIPAVEAKYNKSTNIVTVTLRHPRVDFRSFEKGEYDKPAELQLNFQFKACKDRMLDTVGVLIEEKWESRCGKIAQFYRSLWMTDDVKETKEKKKQKSAPKTQRSFIETVSLDGLRRFRAAIGAHEMSEDEESTPKEVEEAPLDYAIVLAWEPIVQALLEGCGEKYGAADLLSLVHLTNSFAIAKDNLNERILSSQVISSSAKLTGVWDEPHGRTITVEAKLSRLSDKKSTKTTEEGKPIMTIISKFAIRQGQWQTSSAQRANLFKITNATWQLALNSQKMIAVLKSKQWHDLKPEALQLGRNLWIELTIKETLMAEESQTTESGNIRLGDFETTGIILDQFTRQPLAKIKSDQKGATACIVSAFMNRHAQEGEPTFTFEQPQLYPSSVGKEGHLTAPHSNFIYALASKDVNPIHTNIYATALASLPTTIVHGMYSSAKGRQLIQKTANGRILRYEAKFSDMVLPGRPLSCKCLLLAMREGKKLVKLEMRDAMSNSVVMTSIAEVEQPTTAFIFTGQGSARVGMGMDLYDTSPPTSAVRRVWDEADIYFRNKYGFSILYIVRNNPDNLKVSLSGPKGKQIRANYAALTTQHAEQKGKDDAPTITTTPLFPQALDSSVDHILFRAPRSSPDKKIDGEGLLFQTQFQQPAILLAQKAEFEDMKSRGLTGANAMFAGHSLGEYGAVGCLLSTLDVPTLAEVVFLRGLTMQSAVPRDSAGRSRYGMVAVSPIRVGPWFTENEVDLLVNTIAKKSKKLLQVVNYNVRGFQYVVAGELTALEAMRIALDSFQTLGLSLKPEDFQRGATAMLQEASKLVDDALVQANKNVSAAKDGFLAPIRGKASIPLPGIDVPFHSNLLTGGVDAFRKILNNTFQCVRDMPNPQILKHLEGRYIPNLLGVPFQLTKSFAEEILKHTDSEIIRTVLEKWETNVQNDFGKQDVTLTLLIELLAYQFASPVQWIKTQDVMFTNSINRFIEVGPSPVLLNMLQKSISPGITPPTLLWTGRDMDTIRCLQEGVAEDSIKEEELIPSPIQDLKMQSPLLKSTPAPTVIAELAPLALPVSSSGGGSQSLPLPPVHALRTIISQKLKVTLAEVPPNKTIRELCGGKSALQNEILGDVGAEFGAELEAADETPLITLGQKIAARGTYKGPGKVLAQLSSRSLQRALPGGFGLSKAKQYLQSAWRMNSETADGCIVHTLVVPVAKMSNDKEAQDWLDTVASSYGRELGVGLSKGSSGGGGGSSGGSSGAVVAVVDAKEVMIIKNLLKKQAKALSEYLEESAGEVEITAGPLADLRESLDVVEGEHGLKYVEGIRPAFDSYKFRRYDSWWAWGRQDCVRVLTKLKQLREDLPPKATLERELYLISNRADSSVVSMIKAAVIEFEHIIKQTVLDSSDDSKQRLKQVKYLQELVSESHGAPDTPRYLEYRKPSLPITKVSPKGIQFSFTERYKNGFEGFVQEMLNEDNPNRFIVTPALKPEIESKESKTLDKNLDGDGFATSDPDGAREKIRAPDHEKEYSRILRLAMGDLAKKGLHFAGKTAIITGAGEGSIGLEMARSLLLGGAHVIVTTSRPERKRWETYKKVYQKYCGKGARLTVVPFNGASKQDTEALVAALFDPKLIGIKRPDFLLPFAAIPENGRDITRIDEQSELAHRAMLTNVVRLLGALKKRLEKEAAEDPALITSAPVMVLLPLSPNHGIFGGDGLYAESKLALEALFAKWRSEGWSEYISIVGAEIGWTRGTGLMNSNDLIAQGIEEETGLRTFDRTEMAWSLTSLLAPEVVELARHCPIKADFSGGFKVLAAKGQSLPAARLRQALLDDFDIVKAVENDSKADLAITKGITPQVKPNLQARANLRLDWPTLTPQKPGQGILPLHHNENVRLLEGMVDLSSVPVVVGFGEVGPFGSARTRWEWELLGKFTVEGSIELARSLGLIKFTENVPGTNHVGWVDAKTNAPVLDGDVAAKYGEQMRKHCGIRRIEPELFEGYDPANKLFLQQVALEAPLEPFEISSAQEESHLRQRHGKLLEVFKDEGRTVARLKKGAVIYVPKYVSFDREVAGQIPTGWNPQHYGIPPDLKVDAVTLYALAATMDAFASAGISDPYELYEYVHVSEVGNCAGGGMGGSNHLKYMFRQRLLETPGLSSDLLQETFINTTPAWINMLLLSSAGPIKTPVAACATAATSIELGAETIRGGKAKVMICGGYEDFGEEGSYEFGQMKATSSSAKEQKMGREPNEMCRPAASTRGGFMESHGAGIQVLTTAKLALDMGLPIYAIIAAAHTATDRQGRSVPAPGQGILTTARECIPQTISFTTEEEKKSIAFRNPLLDMGYRRKELERELAIIQAWYERELGCSLLREREALVTEKMSGIVEKKTKTKPKSRGKSKEKIEKEEKEFDGESPKQENQDSDGQEKYVRGFLLRERDRRMKAARRVWGTDFFNQGGQDSEVSPLRGSLAVWGLSIDDLEVASFHGTGTQANDKNESEVIQKQMEHLRRTPGKPLPSIWQKWMTGHPKGAAAAWMLNGLIQTLLSGNVPGNRNLDNVCKELRGFTHVLYMDRALGLGRPLKAGYLHSFGFGQAGAEVVIVHPDFLFATVDNDTYSSYKKKRGDREISGNLHWLHAMQGQRPMLKIKNVAPFADTAAQQTYLNPSARTHFQETKSQYEVPTTPTPSPPQVTFDVPLVKTETTPNPIEQALGSDLRSLAGGSSLSGGSSLPGFSSLTPSTISSSPVGIGIDMEPFSTFTEKDQLFLSRNFTDAELSYCRRSPDFKASLAARWCAKEAVIKAVSSYSTSTGPLWKSAGAPLKEIEVSMSESGAPAIRFHGQAREIAQKAGVHHVALSLSHTDTHAVAQALIR